VIVPLGAIGRVAVLAVLDDEGDGDDRRAAVERPQREATHADTRT
jgi:hypothetical protein